VLIAAEAPEDAARVEAALSACGFASLHARYEAGAGVAEALATDAATDALLVAVSASPNALDSAARAAAERALPIVLLAEHLTPELAELGYDVGARVCLYSLGAESLRKALVCAGRDRAERRAAQAAEEAARANERVRALVNVSVADVVFHLGVEGDRFRFLEINPAFTKATGLSAEQITGKRVDEVIPEPSLSLVLARYREAIAERRTVRWVEETQYPTGTKYGEVSVTPVVDARGECSGLVGTVHDVTEERERDETIRRYADIVRAVQIGLAVWSVPDPAAPQTITLLAFNPEGERMANVDLGAALGRPVIEALPWTRGTLVDLACAVARDGVVREVPDLRSTNPASAVRTLAVKAFPLPGACVGLAFEDVSEQAQARAVNAAEQKVLERVASGAPLAETLSALAVAIEAIATPALASVLLLDGDGKRLRHGAAPNLPEGYVRAIDGAEIGPMEGSCGAAAYLKRRIIASDLETDPRWERYRELAGRFELRACWSTPILAGNGRVLGTFALYYRTPRSPSPADLDLIERATHVADIAIQRHELDEQLRALTARIEAAREEERTGIAREIHDQLGQSLTAIKMDLSWIARRAQSTDGVPRETLLEKLQELTELTSETIDQVRRISSELRPGVLDDLGLVSALGWQAHELEKRTGLVCAVHAAVDDDAVSRELATTVFRVFQEALTNVVRHAEAKRVDVGIAARGGELVLEVRDDGRGIRPEEIQDPRSLGLLGIRERARRMGGSATYERVEPTGTLLMLRLPLPSTARHAGDAE
jgi:PAS domain S-box-containing protein